MKMEILLFVFFLCAVKEVYALGSYIPIVNPSSGKPDYVTLLTSATLPSGSTQYIQNTASLQSGSTAYPDNLYVGTQATIPALTVRTSTSSAYEATFSTSAATFHVAISTSGHFITYGSPPTVSACGAVPNGSVVAADDNGGTILIGGGVPTSCTLTFAKTWGVAPHCSSISNTTVVVDGIGSISATAVTFNFSAASGLGTFWYRCGCSGTGCL